MVGVIYATDHDEFDLSGEWADRLTGPQAVREILFRAGVTHNIDDPNSTDPIGHAPGTCEVCDWWDATGDILDAMEEGFNFYNEVGDLTYIVRYLVR
jgi:hypothetical protein